MYPKNFEKLIEALTMFPGVGAKTAQRYAFSLLERPKEDIDNLIENLKGLKKISYCEKCGFLCDDECCEICKDESRDKSTIMVVAYPQDLVAIEKVGQYHGLYHVLNGVISSNKGIYPEDINIASLLNRLDGVKEVILAISPTMDGEMTSLYLDKLLKDRNILITRLAHGLPMGASLDYADDMTLIKALSYRHKFEE